MIDIDLTNIKKIDFNELLWDTLLNYYDGMLTAIAFYNNNPVYVNCVNDPDLVEKDGLWGYLPRVYFVYELTDKEYTDFQRNNILFKAYVGLHNVYDPITLRRPWIFQSKEPESRDKYYKDENKPKFEPSCSNCIGYMTDNNLDPNEVVYE